jgi:hypothetical protein
MEVNGHFHTPATGTHCIGGWVGPRASGDSCLCWESNPDIFYNFSNLKIFYNLNNHTPKYCHDI